jgi:hypothetical protein
MNFLDSDDTESDENGSRSRTIIRVRISPVRGRERRDSELVTTAKTLVRSLRSYLMAYRYDIHNHRRALAD